jgi:RNA polymerase sigma-70 factor (ECF subfamily)
VTPQQTGPNAAVATEDELVERARRGEVAAFEELVGLHADRLFALVVRIMGDRRDAEDVVQETLLRAWRSIPRFQARSMFFTWLYRIAVNESNRALEKRARKGPSVPVDEATVQLAAPAELGPAPQAEHRELREHLEQAIAGLPLPYRTAVVLRDVEGLSTRQAAEIAGVGEAAFKSRLHQARMRIREALGDAALLGAPLSRIG